MSLCQDMLVNFDSGACKRLYEAGTGYELWIYQFDQKLKDNLQFVFLKVKNRQQKSRSIGKKCWAHFFFKKWTDCLSTFGKSRKQILPAGTTGLSMKGH